MVSGGRGDTPAAPQRSVPCPLQASVVTGRTTSPWHRARPSTVSTVSRCGDNHASPGTCPQRTPAPMANLTPSPAPALAPLMTPSRHPQSKLVTPRPLSSMLRRRRRAGGGAGGPVAHQNAEVTLTSRPVLGGQRRRGCKSTLSLGHSVAIGKQHSGVGRRSHTELGLSRDARRS